jgi:hypothetical protein
MKYICVKPNTYVYIYVYKERESMYLYMYMVKPVTIILLHHAV